MNHFFIVGAQRSGTTWLYKLLEQHPQIQMARPIRPEPKYFLGTQCSRAEYLERYFSILNRDVCVIGEKSTSYIESELAAKKIKECFEDAKILVLLRNPVDRALSNYFFSLENGLEKRTVSDVFIDAVPPPRLDKNISTDPFDYLLRSRYELFLPTYYTNFCSDNILVLCLERLLHNPSHLAAVYSFLGCTISFNPEGFYSAQNVSNVKAEVSPAVRQRLYKYFRNTREYMKGCIDISDWECP